MNVFKVGALALLACTVASSGEAQILQRPERPIRGLFGGRPQPDPNRTRQEVTLTLDSLGGYDDNLVPVETTGIESLAPHNSGYTGFAAAALLYWRGRQTRTFEVRGRGYVNSFRNLGVEPTYGGDLQARLTTPLGERRRHDLELAGASRSDPFYSPATLGPLRADVASGTLPDANPANGYYMRRSLANEARISLTNRWSTRDTVTLGYRYDMREFNDHDGDSRSHIASFDYARTLGRRAGLRTTYRHSESTLFESAGPRPLAQDGIELGFQHEQRLTPTRRFWFGVGAGAAYVSTLDTLTRLPRSYVLPSGYGNALLDIGRTWNVSGEYRRALSVIEGLTLQEFVTDAATVRTGGYAGERSEIVFSAAYSNGAAAPGSTGTFDSYMAAAQFRFLITRTWSAVVGHSFYSYRTRGIPDLPAGFSETLNRNALRVGMTFDLPLYGAYVVQRPERPGRD
jgi:hypothetical protein